MVCGFFTKKKNRTSNFNPNLTVDHMHTAEQRAAAAHGGQTRHFTDEWGATRAALRTGMTGEYPRFDNGEGPKKTIYPGQFGLRYDREKVCQSYGHPHDRFQNYSIQANRGAQNNYLSALAANSNGSHRVPAISTGPHPHTFGGPTRS
jgi:hypothetical protein